MKYIFRRIPRFLLGEVFQNEYYVRASAVDKCFYKNVRNRLFNLRAQRKQIFDGCFELFCVLVHKRNVW